MGNVAIKERGDPEIDERNIYLSSLATESENLSSSVISEDAISLTTDSTATTTEYESANENDNCSNRVSTSTDIWYDFSSSVKSLVNEPTYLEDLSADNSSSEVSRLICGICENSSSGFVAVPECCGDSHLEWRPSPKQETFHDLSNFVQDVGANLVVRAKSSNDDEFAKENYDLIRKWHRRTRNGSDMKNHSKFSRKTTKTKPVRKNFRRGWKFNGSESTVQNKQNDGFVGMAYALSKALDQVSLVLESPAARKTYDEIETLIDSPVDVYALVLWNLEIIKFLNNRLAYSAVFQFSYDDVRVFCDDDSSSSQKLREIFVRRFLSQDSYCDDLNLIVFRMKCQLKGLHYMIEVPDKSVLRDLNEFFVEPKINFERISDRNFVKKTGPNAISPILSPPGVQHHRQQFNHEHANKIMMNCSKENISEAGPATAADIDINNVPFLNDSSELDFISKAGGTGLVAETLRKQSLYVKFDPLVAQDVNSTLNDNTIKLDDSSIANNTLTAAVNNLKLDTSQENKTSAEVTTNSPKLNETSVGQLISVTPSKSPRRITPKSSPRYADTDPDDVAKLQSLLLKQMKKEEVFKEEIESLKLENEQVLKKLQNSEQEISNLKSVLEAVQENEKKLKNELMERIKSKQQLSLIMEEYEKTMSQMVSKRDEEKKEFDAMMKKIEAERDNTLQHLNNLENAFNDIHQKYERGKAVNEALKKNEDLLKKSLNEYEQTVKTVENKYELLKSHATSQLEKANQELELITQSYEKEQAKMKAMLKKSEIQINSLQNALERKSKENQELTAICDELIVKLSTHSNS